MKENLFILTGPTAIGKTNVSIELAKALNGEIISADSMQIYKHMDIGTAKIKKEEMQEIPHYLVDIIDPDEDFTVANYKENAQKFISEINSKEKLPIVVGGTGLYINSLIYDLNFTKVPSDPKLREKLEKIGEEYGNDFLHNKLKQIDEESSIKINKNDRKRIIRAIEIYKITGKPRSLHNNNFRKPNNEYNFTMIGLNMDRKDLYDRINARVDSMIDNGLLDEVKSLLDMGYNKDLISMQAIGYKELIMYLEGKISLEESIEVIKKASRHYAKRQLTWFRRNEFINWINIDAFPDKSSLIEYIICNFKNKTFQ